VIDSIGRVRLGKERQVRLNLGLAAGPDPRRALVEPYQLWRHGAGCSAGRQPEPPQPGSAYNS
jgi:hypothetical protein